MPVEKVNGILLWMFQEYLNKSITNFGKIQIPGL